MAAVVVNNMNETINNVNFSEMLNNAAEEMKQRIHSEEEAQAKLISISGIMGQFADLMKAITGADKLTERLAAKMAMATEFSVEAMANDFMADYQRYVGHLTADQQMKLRVLSGCKSDASVPTMVLKMVTDLQKGIERFFKKHYNKIPKGIVLKTVEEIFGLGRAVIATIHYGIVKAVCIAGSIITKAAAAVWEKVKGVWAWFKGHAPGNRVNEEDFDLDEDFNDDFDYEFEDFDLDEDFDTDNECFDEGDFDAWVAAHENDADEAYEA